MERTIVLVDDHSLFRNGLRGLLERCAACRVVGEAASGEEFLAMLGGIDNEDNMAALQKLIDQALANDSAK